MTDTVELSRESIERLASEMARLSSTNRSPVSIPGNIGASLTDVGSKLSGAANSFIDVFGKISTGTANHTDILKATTFVLEKFGGTIGNVAGNALQTLGNQVFAINDTMKVTGEYGVTLGSNLGEFGQAVMRSHLTLNEFAAIVSETSQELVGMGGGMDASARNFTKLLDDISVTDAARDLKAAGIGAEELAKIAQVASMNQRGAISTAKDEDKARKDATASVIYLAEEIDLATQITGKRRSQELAELKKEQQRADTQALIGLKGEQFAKNLENATVGMSESAKRLIAVYASGGPRSKEDIDLVATYGGAANNMAQLAKTLESGDVKAIERDKIATQAAIADRMKDRSLLQGIVATEGKLFGSVAGDVLKQEMAAARSIAAKQAEMGEGTTSKEAIDSMRAAEKDRLKGVKDGQLDTSAATSRAINSLDNLTKVVSATMSDGFRKLNDNLGETNKDAIPKFNGLLKEMSSPEGVLFKFKSIGESITTFGKNVELPVGEKPKIRQTGTMGATGDLIEKFDPKGELVELHGEESVIPKADIPKFIQEYVKKSGSSMDETLKSLGVQGFNPSTAPATDKAEDNKKETARIEYLKTLVTKAVVDSKGNVQHAYSPDTVAYAERMLKDFGVESPTKKINKALAEPPTEKINKALAEPPKTVDPLSKVTGLTSTLKDWQANIKTMSKPETKPVEPPAPTPAPETKPAAEPTPAPAAEQPAITELKDYIVQLNSTLRELISHTDAGVDKQVKAIKSLSGNRLG